MKQLELFPVEPTEYERIWDKIGKEVESTSKLRRRLFAELEDVRSAIAELRGDVERLRACVEFGEGYLELSERKLK